MSDISGVIAGWNNPSSVIGQVLVKGLFSGSSDTSLSASKSGALLDTSGQVIGEGYATGGKLSTMASPAAWPWYVWASGALLAIAIIKKRAA